MNIHEYQAKQLFAEFGIPVPAGVACHKEEEFAAAIDQTDFPGGQALDISCDSAFCKTAEARKKFHAVVRSYFELGGLQLQVNAVSVEDLRNAQKEPERYRDLIVRIGGYSARFVQLPPRIRQEMIERFESSS